MIRSAPTARPLTGSVQGSRTDDEEERVGRRHGEVGKRAHRLHPLPVRLGRLHPGDRPPVVQLRAADQQDVADQVDGIGPARAAASGQERNEVERQVRDDADQHAAHEETERQSIAVHRAAEEHGRDPEQDQHAGERIRERQRGDRDPVFLRGRRGADREVPDGHAAADEHHRRVEPELPPLEAGPSGQREGEERGEREERVAEVEWVGPRDGGVEMEHEQIEDGDRIADEDHRGTDGQQTQRSPDAGVEDRTPRGQRVEYQHRHVERHERHVADQVAHGRTAPSASFPEQIAEGVESGEERDSERRPPGPVADYGM